MFHELLFALSGFPGDVFVPYPPAPDIATTYAVLPAFPLLHAAERESLNRLGQLGWIYAQLNGFVTSTKNLKHARQRQTQPHGAYVQAMITALEDTLNEYRQTLLDMEQRILNKQDEAGAGIIPLSLLTSTLSRWELLLPALYDFVLRLQETPEAYHGCKLFDLLMNQARTGIYELRLTMEKMIHSAHDVLYRQLTAWMVYGQCVDPYNEFFIQRVDSDQTNAAGWQRHYTLAKDRIPSHLTLAVAESVLFVGRAIATVTEMDTFTKSILREDPQNDEYDSKQMLQGQLLLENRQKIQIPNDMKHRHLQLLFSLHSQKSTASPWLSYPQQLQQVVHDIQKSTAEWLFSQVLVDRHSLERYLYSFRQMFLLGHGDLAVNLIEECSHWRRRSILRSGDKRSSSGQSSDRESTRSSSHKSASTIFRHQELNALLVKASVGTDAEDTLHGYSLRILDDSQETGFADLLLMDAQCWLTYEMRWPIDLFLSEADLARYGELWCFLIGLRSVQMSLSGLWQYLRGGKESDRSEQWIHKGNHGNDEEGFEERLIWRLRSRMIFWVDALWSHMQANVINTHYENLIDMVSPCSEQSKKRRSVSKPATLDFEEIQVAHDDYLGNITRGCLLTSSRCSEAMNHTLRTCVDFCELVKQLSEDEEWLFRKRRKTTKTASEIVRQWTQPSTLAQNPWIHRICELEEIFNSSTELFFELITHQSQEVKSSGNLDLLLMQLDYNNWYSK